MHKSGDDYFSNLNHDLHRYSLPAVAPQPVIVKEDWPVTKFSAGAVGRLMGATDAVAVMAELNCIRLMSFSNVSGL